WVVRQSAEVENQFTSVERILTYNDLPPEGPQVIEESRPPSDWPRKGVVRFKDVKMKYREELDHVLGGVSVIFEERQKIGICGRTGAGKVVHSFSLPPPSSSSPSSLL